MKEAEAKRARLLAKGKNEKVHGPRLDECVEKYLASRERELDVKRLGYHRCTLADRLVKFCSARGVYFIEGLTVDFLEDFKLALPSMSNEEGEMKTTTLAKHVERLKTFVAEARRREWIKEVLIDRLTGVRAVYEEKSRYAEPSLVVRS